MTATIKVDTAKLKSTASSLKTTGSNIAKITSSMTGTVNTLTGSIWSGEAAEKYKKKFNNLQDDISRMKKMIDEHVADLQKMAIEYENAEAENITAAAALKDDIIS